jgi:hypothetical protein
MAQKFKEWFEKKLTVGGFPYKVNQRFEAKDYDIVINVSDEWYLVYEQMIRECFTSHYWFPMNESKKDIGLNSIYGAMVILRFAENRNLSVYLHCHAGVNRSEIVRAAYYFMRTNKQIETQQGTYINKLVAACSRGYLPPKAEMESFLGHVASNIKNMQGGILDVCKIESINNF